MNTQKPTLIHVIAWTTLASGIVNIFWGIAALSTFIGFICAPLSILPIILGVFEIIYAAKLFSNPPQVLKPSTNIAIFEIACLLFGNVFSAAVGILSLVFYNDTVVKEYFTQLNNTSVTVTPLPSASLPKSAPATAVETISQPVEESPAPKPEALPAKPKRTLRKVAKK